MTKMLIDECLSAELALMARERGHHETSHVVWIGKAGWKDWKLKEVLLNEDWVLVTWNCSDFRGSKRAPGSKGQYANVTLHAGLVCIDVPLGMDLAMQRRLFADVLDELDESPDLTNQVLEVSLSEDGGSSEILRYSLPPYIK
jgi:predicted nuclease of predicted toxin-antitoxin system